MEQNNAKGQAKYDVAGWEKIFIDYLGKTVEHKDGSHDLGHFQRVWKMAQYISREEGKIANREEDKIINREEDKIANREEGKTIDLEEKRNSTWENGIADPLILLASAYFHDLVSLPKNHPDRSQSSRLSAEMTARILEEIFEGFPREKIEGVRHAIHAHSFSAGVTPLTTEAKILQDADRMEAIGAIGLARVFYTAGQLGQKLFHAEDPLGAFRENDDKLYALDHFPLKLLKLPSLMNTQTGKRLAAEKAAYLTDFMEKIRREIAGEPDNEEYSSIV
ncbi:HD domain-containing protein [Flavitalea flava]